MYKLTLYDECCSPICDGVATFFVDNLKDFENNWCHRANKEQVERYMRSKNGEIVTDYYNDNPKLNIFQEDVKAEVLWEKEYVIYDRNFSLFNAYQWETQVYATETRVVFRGIKFKNDCFLVGNYKMKGVCQKSVFSVEDSFETIKTWGNPIINCRIQTKAIWHETENGRELLTYRKEDFSEDYLETYCWVTVASVCKEEELRPENLGLESDKTIECLMRDIPGEGG